MIRQHERTSPNEAGRQFKEWASLFSEGLFVILQVFADESVSEGGEKSTPVVPSFCGYIDSSENWKTFTVKWQKTLEKEGNPPKHRVLDFMLLRNRNAVTRKLSTEAWQKVVDKIRNHQKATTARWKREGLDQKYYPEIHFPFEKYGIQ